MTLRRTSYNWVPMATTPYDVVLGGVQLGAYIHHHARRGAGRHPPGPTADEGVRRGAGRHTSGCLWRPRRMTLRETSSSLAAITTTPYDVGARKRVGTCRTSNAGLPPCLPPHLARR